MDVCFQSKISNMERLLQDVQANNTSGRLNWRIDNISQRMEEARTGAIPALYSQPFFTTDAGREKLPDRNLENVSFCQHPKGAD